MTHVQWENINYNHTSQIPNYPGDCTLQYGLKSHVNKIFETTSQLNAVTKSSGTLEVFPVLKDPSRNS